MEEKRYVCIKDFQDAEFMLGKALTIDEWKQFLLRDRKNSLLEIFSSTDDEFINEMNEYIRLKGMDVINMVQDFYDIKIIPLENSDFRYIVEDTGKLLTEKDVRKMLYEMECEDLLNNKNDFIDGSLNLDAQFREIYMSLNGYMTDVLYTLNSSWNIPVKKIEYKG